MAIIMDSSGGPAETSLAGVAIYQIKLAPHNDSRARLFAFVHDEGAVFETEIVVDLRKQSEKLYRGEYFSILLHI